MQSRNCSSPISKRSCEFFCKKLGFSLVFSHGDPRYYAQVGRDAARLNLRCVDGLALEQTVRDCQELLSASLPVATADEIKLLFLRSEVALQLHCASFVKCSRPI